MRNEEPDMPLKEQHYKHKIKNKEKIEDLRVFLFLALCVYFDIYIII
jgi:nitrate reductase NapE component